MKPKTIILMGVAIACGLAASFMTSKVLSDRGKTVEMSEDKVAYLVARTSMPLGTGTKDPDRLFAVKFVPKGMEPKRAIRAAVDSGSTEEIEKKLYEQVKDRRTNRPLRADDPISAEDLIDAQQSGLSAVMQKGYRALGVKVDTSAVAGGFVLPNSRVDVVWVQRRGESDSTARVILQNVLVLAVGQQSQRPEEKQSLIESTVTLAVTPEQAEKLTLATEMGALRLILRPFGDEEVVKTAGVSPKAISSTGEAADATGGPVEAEPTEVISRPANIWPNRLPEVPKTQAPNTVAAAQEPKVETTSHFVMTIHNGESIKRVKFALGDENGETTREELQRSTLPPATAPAPLLGTGSATPATVPGSLPNTPAGK